MREKGLRMDRGFEDGPQAFWTGRVGGWSGGLKRAFIFES